MSDGMHDVDGGTGFAEPEAIAGNDLPVAFGMQVGKTVAEFNLFAVHFHGTEGALAGCLDILRQSIVIDAQEIANPGFFEPEVSGNAIMGCDMNNIFFNFTENPG